MAVKDDQLSKRERQAMDIVYRLGKATAEEIQAEMPDDPSYSAVRALLGVLVPSGGGKWLIEAISRRDYPVLQGGMLLLGGMVMVGAVALQKPAVDMGHIQPLARLTSDYLIAAVPAASSIKTGKDLANAMRTDLAALPVAGEIGRAHV